ncbi:MAG: methyltransferase domain-containing protein [Myxococcaceae bacterium]
MLTTIYRRSAERKLTAGEVRYARILLEEYATGKTRYSSAVQENVVRRADATNRTFLGKHEGEVVARMLAVHGKGKALSIDALQYLSKMLDKARHREAFKGLVTKLTLAFTEGPDAISQARLEQFFRLLETVSVADWASYVSWEQISNLVNATSGERRDELRRGLLDFMRKRSVLASSEDFRAMPPNVAVHFGNAEHNLLMLLPDIATLDQDGAIALLRDAVLHKRGLRVQTDDGMNAAIRLMEAFSTDPTVRALMTKYTRERFVPDGRRAWWKQQAIGQKIQAILEPPAPAPPPLPATLDPIDGHGLRMEVVDEIRRYWQEGVIADEKWLRRHDEPLLKKGTHRDVFPRWAVAMRAAGIPKRLQVRGTGEADRKLYTRDETNERLRQLSAEDFEPEAARTYFPHLFASALEHYRSWPEALQRNGRPAVSFPKLSNVTSDTVAAFCTQSTLESTGRRQLKEARAELTVAQKQFSMRNSAEALKAFVGARELAMQASEAYSELALQENDASGAPASTKKVESANAMVEQIQEGLSHTISRILSNVLKSLPANIAADAANGEEASITQATKAAIQRYPLLADALPTEYFPEKVKVAARMLESAADLPNSPAPSKSPVLAHDIDQLSAAPNDIGTVLRELDLAHQPLVAKAEELLQGSAAWGQLRGSTTSAASYEALLSALIRFASPLKGLTLLEVGPGVPVFLSAMRKLGWPSKGLENDFKFSQLAKGAGVNVTHGTLFDPPREWLRTPFDVTLSRDVLNQLLHLGVSGPSLRQEAFRCLARLTKPGGFSVHETPPNVRLSFEELRSAGFRIVQRDAKRGLLVLQRFESPLA